MNNGGVANRKTDNAHGDGRDIVDTRVAIENVAVSEGERSLRGRYGDSTKTQRIMKRKIKCQSYCQKR